MSQRFEPDFPPPPNGDSNPLPEPAAPAADPSTSDCYSLGQPEESRADLGESAASPARLPAGVRPGSVSSPEKSAAARPRKRERRVYQRHGLTPLLKQVSRSSGKELQFADGEGMRRLNRILRAQKGDLFESRGGEEAVSPQERMLIEAIVRTWFLLESVDAWLLENKALVNKRKRALFPIVLQRGQLADSLARYLTALGLERRKPPAKALADIIASTVRNGGTEA